MAYKPARQKDVRRVFREELDSGQRAALLSWLAFTATFAGVRGITYAIKDGKGPFKNLSVGGEHLYHYMWGIGMVSGVGGVAVHGDNERRRHPLVAVAYGAGLALIVDEFALLLDLQDVYWAKQGRISVDLAVGGSSLAGSYFAALPLLRALRRRVKLRRSARRFVDVNGGYSPPNCRQIGGRRGRSGACGKKGGE
jgi:hypothetical protein